MIEIRLAQFPEDAIGIAAIDNTFSTNEILHLEVHQDGFDLRRVPQTVAKRFPVDDLLGADRPWDKAWVATSVSRICGFAATGYASWNRRLVLWHFYVDQHFRRKGIGARLMDAVSSQGIDVGARHIWLETSNLNSPGIAAYQALGFTVTGTDMTLYDGTPAEGEFAIFMSRPLMAASAITDN